MSAPVIVITQSVLEYAQWQSFNFQPYATNNPTSWAASFLPPGLSFNTSTGKLSGAASMPGVYLLALTAYNADGHSDTEVFTMGIVAAGTGSAFASPDDAIDLVWDVGTGEVSAISAVPATKLADGTEPALPLLFWLKRGDTRILNVRQVKAGVTVAAVALSALKLSLKAVEPEAVLVATTTFARVGTGADTFYRMSVVVTGTTLTGELANAEDDRGTELACLAELEAASDNPYNPTPGPATLKTTSLNFGVGIARDLIP